METKPKVKAKRKLSQIDFSGVDSHIALVSKNQGGPAHGADYKLVVKANRFSEEAIEKMQQVKVTLELPDFLSKFFGLYGDQAEVLARMMGYREIADTQAEEDAEAEMEYKDWIDSQMEAFEIIKSLGEASNIAEVLSQLSEDEYLALLNDQQRLEKAFEKLEKAYKGKVGDMVTWNSSGGKATGKIEHVMREGTLGVPGTEFSINATAEDPAALIRIYKDGEPTETLVGHKTSTLAKVTKALANKSTKVTSAVTKGDTSPASEVINEGVSTSEQTQMEKSHMDEKEMIEKAALVELQKSFAETQELLKAAQAQVQQYEADKKAAVEKARQLEVNTAVKDGVKAAVIFKAIKEASDEDFQAVVKALAEMQEVIEKSALFQEQGATTQEETSVKESPIERLLKAKFQSK